jgi:hypothetical protein
VCLCSVALVVGRTPRWFPPLTPHKYICIYSFEWRAVFEKRVAFVGPLRSVRKNRAELSAPAATARRRSSFVRASVCVLLVVFRSGSLVQPVGCGPPDKKDKVDEREAGAFLAARNNYNRNARLFVRSNLSRAGVSFNYSACAAKAGLLVICLRAAPGRRR